MTFYDELETIINKHSIENDSNTPDFILAKYMHDRLGAFNNAMIHRDKWYGLNQDEIKAKRIVWELCFINNERTEGYSDFFDSYEEALDAEIVDGSGTSTIRSYTYEPYISDYDNVSCEDDE